MFHVSNKFSVLLWFLDVIFCTCYNLNLWGSFFIKNIPVDALQLQILNLIQQFFRHMAWSDIIGNASNNFSVILWLLNIVFLCLLWLEPMKFHFYQKHACECIETSKFDFFQHFLGTGHDRSCVKRFSNFEFAQRVF